MPLSTKVSGSWHDVPNPSVRVSGTWRAVAAGWVKVSGAWRQFYTAVPALSASLSPTSLSGSGYGAGPFTTSGSSTCTPAGGVSPYSYAWENVSGDGTLSATAPTSATTAFSASGTPTQTKNSVWRCKVTDNAGTVAYSDTVAIALTFNPALAASLSPTSVSGTDTQAGPPYSFNPITTGSSTTTASGGAGGYSYAWEYVSGASGFSCNASTSAATTWSYTAVPISPATYTAYWRCKVTDSAANVAYTANVTVTAYFDGA